ncbi:MAG: hypothetical protein ACLFV7_13890 [Phycisphaerae bacterium]
MELRKIGLLLAQDGGWQRGVLLGVTSAARPARPWPFHQNSPHTEGLRHLLEWEPEALIAHAWQEDLIDRIRRLNIPAVCTCHVVEGNPLP